MFDVEAMLIIISSSFPLLICSITSCVAAGRLQVLDVATQLGDVTDQQYALNRQFVAAAFPVHHYIRSARNAVVRWKV